MITFAYITLAAMVATGTLIARFLHDKIDNDGNE